jgi:serine/threonine-protein kinase RsbW
MGHTAVMPGADAQLGRHRDVPRLSFVLPAIPVSAPAARHRLRAWLAMLDWPTDLAEDLEFATNEAVANVIDHAYLHIRPAATEWEYPGADDVVEEIVEVVARERLLLDGARQIRIEIRDRGHWRPPPADPGYRGRGLMTMAAMTDQMTVQHGSPDNAGTTVTLLSPTCG